MGRGAYGLGARRRLAEADITDLPRNGPFILGGMANQGVGLNDLVEELGVTKQAASQLIDTLVTRGFLERQSVPGDRRRISLVLTERGRRAATAVRQGILDVDAHLTAAISHEQLHAMEDGLRALVEVRKQLEEEPGAVNHPPDGPGVDSHPVLEAHTRRVFSRRGMDRLGDHLAARYGVKVGALSQLDVGINRVQLDDGRRWVARVLPAGRPLELAHQDAAVLGFLGTVGFPAERLATDNPVSVMEDQAVVVTQYVKPVARQGRREAIRQAGGWDYLGEQLGVLHNLAVPEQLSRAPGGAWHHLTDGSPDDELAAALALVEAAREAALAASGTSPPESFGAADAKIYALLEERLAGAPQSKDLPHCLVHADYVMANVVAAHEGGLVLVDWTGAGTGPRAWSLAFFLWNAGSTDMTRVDRAMGGYGRQVQLTEEELGLLPTLITLRPLVLEAWSLAMGRKSAAECERALEGMDELASAIAQRALDVVGS